MNDQLASPYEVHWFHKNKNNMIIELETSNVQKSDTAERTVFGMSWFGRNFTDEVIGDIWCQPKLTNYINATLSKSQILTIHEKNYYQNFSTCSGVKFLRGTRCISVLKRLAPATPATTQSSFITPSITRTTLSFTTETSTSAARSSFITPSYTMTTLSSTSEITVKNTRHSTESIATTTMIVENSPSVSTSQQESSLQEKLLIILIVIGGCIMVLLIILILVLIIIIIQRKRSKGKLI